MSYVRQDRSFAEQVSRGLEAAGFTVWWDRHIHGGADFATEIDRELTAARVVIVLWSAASQASQWVRDEASQARDEHKLIANDQPVSEAGADVRNDPATNSIVSVPGSNAVLVGSPPAATTSIC